MDVNFERQADAVERALLASASPDYEKLWNVIDRIAADAEEAKHARWTNYISSRDLWGTRIPGTDLTMFWRTDEDGVLVVLLVTEAGL